MSNVDVTRVSYNLGKIRESEAILAKVSDSFAVLTEDEILNLLESYSGYPVETTDPTREDNKAWGEFRTKLYNKVTELGDYKEYFCTLLP